VVEETEEDTGNLGLGLSQGMEEVEVEVERLLE